MAQHIIKMPDIGEGIAEVELVAWRVQAGDTVAEDQVLADVMTDKATVEIPSPVAGRVLALGGAVGQVLAVGAELIRLEVAEGARGAEPVRAPGPPQAVPAARAAAEATRAPVPAAAGPSLASVAPKPAAPVTPRAAPPTAAHPPGADRPIASPAVRRRAWELGIDLRAVAPTGPAGRIMQADLEAYLAHAETGLPASTGSYAARQGESVVPVIGLRRKIAQRMQEAKRRIPHFTYVEEVDVTELEALRARLNALHGATRGHLTLLPFLLRAIVVALPDFPDLNAHYDDEAGQVTRYAAVHLGVATQTPGGLMVPVLRHAEARDLWSMAKELARLADAARAGRVTRDELTGSTLTVTSLGPLGGLVSTPVINPPEVAIVGVNRIAERPVFRGAAFVPRQMMNLSSSFDHRIVDGQRAAEFVQTLRAGLECPATLFVV